MGAQLKRQKRLNQLRSHQQNNIQNYKNNDAQAQDHYNINEANLIIGTKIQSNHTSNHNSGVQNEEGIICISDDEDQKIHYKSQQNQQYQKNNEIHQYLQNHNCANYNKTFYKTIQSQQLFFDQQKGQAKIQNLKNINGNSNGVKKQNNQQLQSWKQLSQKRILPRQKQHHDYDNYYDNDYDYDENEKQLNLQLQLYNKQQKVGPMKNTYKQQVEIEEQDQVQEQSLKDRFYQAFLLPNFNNNKDHSQLSKDIFLPEEQQEQSQKQGKQFYKNHLKPQIKLQQIQNLFKTQQKSANFKGNKNQKFNKQIQRQMQTQKLKTKQYQIQSKIRPQLSRKIDHSQCTSKQTQTLTQTQKIFNNHLLLKIKNQIPQLKTKKICKEKEKEKRNEKSYEKQKANHQERQNKCLSVSESNVSHSIYAGDQSNMIDEDQQLEQKIQKYPKKRKVFYKKLKNGVKIPIYKYIEERPAKTFTKKKLQSILMQDIKKTIEQNILQAQFINDSKQQLRSKKTGIFYKDSSIQNIPMSSSSFEKKKILTEIEQLFNLNQIYSLKNQNKNYIQQSYNDVHNQVGPYQTIFKNVHSLLQQPNPNANISHPQYKKFYKLADMQFLVQEQMYKYFEQKIKTLSSSKATDLHLFTQQQKKLSLQRLLAQSIKVDLNVNYSKQNNRIVNVNDNDKVKGEYNINQQPRIKIQQEKQKKITTKLEFYIKNNQMKTYQNNLLNQNKFHMQIQEKSQHLQVQSVEMVYNIDEKITIKNGNLLENYKSKALEKSFKALKELLQIGLIKIQVINIKNISKFRFPYHSCLIPYPENVVKQQPKFIIINRVYLNYVKYHQLFNQKMIDHYLNLLQRKQNSRIGSLYSNRNSLNYSSQQFQPQKSISQIYEKLQLLEQLNSLKILSSNSSFYNEWKETENLKGVFLMNYQMKVYQKQINEKISSSYGLLNQNNSILQKSLGWKNQPQTQIKHLQKINQSQSQTTSLMSKDKKQNYQNEIANTNINFNNPKINQFDMDTQVGKYFDLNQNQIEGQDASVFFNGTLKKYQKLALAWMLHREECPIYYNYEIPLYHYDWLKFSKSSSEPLYSHRNSFYIRPNLPKFPKFVKGGILADQMGLGKTIMSVALIATHMRKPVAEQDEKMNNSKKLIKAGTLIIVPTSILGQWQSKIKDYLPNFRVFTFYHKNRYRHYKWIPSNQIVLTTEAILKIQRTKMKKQGNSKSSHGNSLYDFEWFRVIIDEAHNLRNPDCVYFQSLKQLTAQYRWCLSGTPLQNKLTDLHPLLSFLRYSPWDQFQTWKKQFKSAKIPFSESKLQQLKAVMKGILVRRKKQSVDNQGKTLVSLPPFKSFQYSVELSQKQYKKYSKISKNVLDKVIQFEQQYDQFIPNNNEISLNSSKASKQFRIKLNKLLSSTFQKIIKMRQFCCHPSLYYSRSKFILFQNYKKHFDDFVKCRQTSNKRRSKKMILQKLKDQEQQLQLFQKIKTKQHASGSDSFVNSFLEEERKNRQKEKRKKQQIDTYKKIMNREQLKCVVCTKKIKHNGVLTICLHFYCEDCFKHQYKKNAVITNKLVSKRKSFKCVVQDCQQQLHINQFLTLPKINRFNQPLAEIKSNKKTDFVVDYVQNLKPSDKLIVFTSFIGMIEILQQMFKKTSIQYQTMTGEDSHQLRNAKIAKFKSIPQIQVFIISLKCGYAGLNLQMANKLIFIQTWWNPAVQEQAIGRLHRIGQEKQVQVVRLITKNTIQEGMQILGQEKKLISEFILDSDNQLAVKRQKKINQLKLIKQMLMKSVKRIQNQNQQKKKKQNTSELNYQSSSQSSSESQIQMDIQQDKQIQSQSQSQPQQESISQSQSQQLSELQQQAQQSSNNQKLEEQF